MGKKLKTIEDLNDAVSDSDGFSFHEISIVNDWRKNEGNACVSLDYVIAESGVCIKDSYIIL